MRNQTDTQRVTDERRSFVFVRLIHRTEPIPRHRLSREQRQAMAARVRARAEARRFKYAGGRRS